MRYSSNDYTNLRISSNFDLSSDIRNTAGPMYHKRMSFMNDDGTTTEIKKETNMAGKEELLEITYDPQGNIIGRKKADGGSSNVKFKFHELQNYSTYDPMDNYNIYEGGNVYVQTVPTTEIVYQPVESYSIDYSNINTNPFEHDFGSRGYTLMDNNISYGNNVKMVDLNQNNNNSNYNSNENLERYFTDNNTNSYTNNQTSYVTSNNNDYTYNNNSTYNTTDYSNFYQNTSTNNNYNSAFNINDTNNYNYQNSQSYGTVPFQCAKVTKLN